MMKLYGQGGEGGMPGGMPGGAPPGDDGCSGPTITQWTKCHPRIQIYTHCLRFSS